MNSTTVIISFMVEHLDMIKYIYMFEVLNKVISINAAIKQRHCKAQSIPYVYGNQQLFKVSEVTNLLFYAGNDQCQVGPTRSHAVFVST